MRGSALLLAFVVVLSGGCGRLWGQSVQMLFTQSAMPKALALKSALKGVQAEAFPAAALLNISAERKQAYVSKVSSLDSVLVIGEDAAKAVGQIEFPIPVIALNATGTLRGKGPILRVLEADFAGNVPGAKNVSSADATDGLGVSAKTAGEVSIRCQGVPAAAVIQKLLAAVKR